MIDACFGSKWLLIRKSHACQANAGKADQAKDKLMDYASILVTGGCGFIGTSLIDKLRQVNSKLSIRVLDNFVTGTSDDLAGITAYTKSAEECAKGGRG
ncbi:MAG: hypothetical protein R2875_17530 [Desulfobacterales bacterium]